MNPLPNQNLLNPQAVKPVDEQKIKGIQFQVRSAYEHAQAAREERKGLLGAPSRTSFPYER